MKVCYFKRIQQTCNHEVRLWSWRVRNEKANFLFPPRTEYYCHAGHTHGQRWVGLPAKWRAPLPHPHKHTGTHPSCPVSCQSLPNCRDFCQAGVTVQGSEVTTPSTHTPVFICLFVGSCSFISWSFCVTPSIFHSRFFFSLSANCSQTCFFLTCHLWALCRNHWSVSATVKETLFAPLNSVQTLQT